jgi:hypothetical protein
MTSKRYEFSDSLFYISDIDGVQLQHQAAAPEPLVLPTVAEARRASLVAASHSRNPSTTSASATAATGVAASGHKRRSSLATSFVVDAGQADELAIHTTPGPTATPLQKPATGPTLQVPDHDKLVGHRRNFSNGSVKSGGSLPGVVEATEAEVQNGKATK